MLILRNCKLVPELTEGCDLSHADVVINGERIERIVPCGTIPANTCEEMDLQGNTLLPGLIDAHVHLFMVTNKNEGCNEPLHLPGDLAFEAYQHAKWFLDLGFTTLRDVGDRESYPAIAVRNAINAGIVAGPRIKTPGVMLTPPECGTSNAAYFCHYASGADEYRRGVREELMQGADFIKIYGTGSMLSHGSTPGGRIMHEDEIEASVKMAQMKGIYIAAHCHGTEAIDTMVRLGVRTIEHASFISEQTLQKMNGRRDVGIVPTVSISSEAMLIAQNYSQQVLDRFKTAREHLYACLRKAASYDVLIGWGTDIFMDAQAEDPYLEFKVRKEALGYSNIEILKQCTRNSAELIQMDDAVGTVKVGKYADFVVIDGDPVQDITLMYHKPTHVIKGGVVIR